MKKLVGVVVLIIGLQLNSSIVYSQTDPDGLPEYNMVVLKGKVFQEDKKVNETIIEVFRDGELVGKEVTKWFGRFNIPISTNHEYVFRFKQFGKVTQDVAINTHLKDGINGYWETKFDIELIDNEENIDLSIFEKPIMSFSYKEMFDDFLNSEKKAKQYAEFISEYKSKRGNNNI